MITKAKLLYKGQFCSSGVPVEINDIRSVIVTCFKNVTIGEPLSCQLDGKIIQFGTIKQICPENRLMLVKLLPDVANNIDWNNINYKVNIQKATKATAITFQTEEEMTVQSIEPPFFTLVPNKINSNRMDIGGAILQNVEHDNARFAQNQFAGIIVGNNINSVQCYNITDAINLFQKKTSEDESLEIKIPEEIEVNQEPPQKEKIQETTQTKGAIMSNKVFKIKTGGYVYSIPADLRLDKTQAVVAIATKDKRTMAAGVQNQPDSADNGKIIIIEDINSSAIFEIPASLSVKEMRTLIALATKDQELLNDALK